MFKQILEKHNVVLIVKFGSHLYGTNTENSDTDYKGIYIPAYNDVMLNRVSKTLNFDSNKTNEKNSADDIDFEMYSIHYFIELASKGETVAIDMLHANEANIVYQSPLWNTIHDARSMFYTSNMKSLVGYARKQAAKYGIKGSRLASAKNLHEYLKQHSETTVVKDVYDGIAEDINTRKTTNDQGMRVINFCGKQIQETVKVGYAIDIVNRFIEQYGHRAKLAETNDGVDWKAVSHAIRAGFQLQEIFETGDLKFPLAQAEYLRDVKTGKYVFSNVLAVLEKTIDRVEELSEVVDLPETVNNNEVDKFLLKLLAETYNA